MDSLTAPAIYKWDLGDITHLTSGEDPVTLAWPHNMLQCAREFYKLHFKNHSRNDVMESDRRQRGSRRKIATEEVQARGVAILNALRRDKV